MTRRKLEKTILMHGGNIPLVTSVIVLVAFAAGMLVGTLMIVKVYGVNNFSKIVAPMTGSYADGWNAAKAKLAAVNPMMNNTSSLSGQITAVNGKEISFTSSLLNPLDDESLKSRIAVVDDKTKVTVWKLKTSEQIAKDSESARASLNSLQKESVSLRSVISDCDQKRFSATAVSTSASEESSDCKDARAKLEVNMKSMSEAQQKMDMYQKVENATLNDVKVGWSVSAMSLVVKDGSDDKGSALATSKYENISAKQKFVASSIDVREINIPTAGGPIMPANPAVPAK